MIEKIVVTAVLALCFLFLPRVGYEQLSMADMHFSVGLLWRHLAYMCCHANVWHLLGNLFVFWMMCGRLWLKEGVLTAFVMSWVPVWYLCGDGGVTLGFSGVLFAIVGVKWGSAVVRQQTGQRRRLLRDFCRKVLPFALVGAVIPHVNWGLHLYCLLGGFAYGWTRK